MDENRDWKSEADSPTHEDAILIARWAVSLMRPDFEFKATREAFKAYDVMFSDGNDDLLIECEGRDAEKDGNWDKLWEGVYGSIHIPKRKWRQADARWTDYLAFNKKNLYQVALFKRTDLDASTEQSKHLIDGMWEWFIHVPLSRIYYADLEHGDYAHVVRRHLKVSGATISSLNHYTLG